MINKINSRKKISSKSNTKRFLSPNVKPKTQAGNTNEPDNGFPDVSQLPNQYQDIIIVNIVYNEKVSKFQVEWLGACY